MRKTKVICFIGPDGSGKSTLSRHLLDEAEKKYNRVSYLWWLEGENSLIRRIIRKFRAPIERADSVKSIGSGNKKMLRIVQVVYPPIVLFDYILFGLKNFTLPKIFGRLDIMIFDRFIYDPVIFMSEEFGYSVEKKKKLMRICGNLLPKPDVTFIIDVPPSISYSRKKHEIDSIDSAEKMLLAYKNVYPILSELTKGRVVKIDNTGNLEEVKKKVLKESGLFG